MTTVPSKSTNKMLPRLGGRESGPTLEMSRGDVQEKFALNDVALKFGQEPIKKNQCQCDPKTEGQSQAGRALGSPFERLRHCLLPWPVHSSTPVGCAKQQPWRDLVIPQTC